MDAAEALRIVRALAKGEDPHTGTALAAGPAYADPQIRQALSVAATALERLAARQTRETQLPEGAGKPWSATEDGFLGQAFDAGLSIAQLANEHQRSEGAIRSRLARLGKLAPRTTPQTQS